MNPNLIGIGRYQVNSCGCGQVGERDPKTTTLVVGGVVLFAVALGWLMLSTRQQGGSS